MWTNDAGYIISFDRQAAAAGQLGIPVGLTLDPRYRERYNCSFADDGTSCVSHDVAARIEAWAADGLGGAVVHAWHSQSWAMHMFEVGGFDAAERSLITNML